VLFLLVLTGIETVAKWGFDSEEEHSKLA
jgi:hypothetical protein